MGANRGGGMPVGHGGRGEGVVWAVLIGWGRFSDRVFFFLGPFFLAIELIGCGFCGASFVFCVLFFFSLCYLVCSCNIFFSFGIWFTRVIISDRFFSIICYIHWYVYGSLLI